MEQISLSDWVAKVAFAKQAKNAAKAVGAAAKATGKRVGRRASTAPQAAKPPADPDLAKAVQGLTDTLGTAGKAMEKAAKGPAFPWKTLFTGTAAGAAGGAGVAHSLHSRRNKRLEDLYLSRMDQRGHERSKAFATGMGLAAPVAGLMLVGNLLAGRKKPAESVEGPYLSPTEEAELREEDADDRPAAFTLP